MRLTMPTVFIPLLLTACMSGGGGPPAAEVDADSKQAPPATAAPENALQAHGWQLAGAAVVEPRPWLHLAAEGQVRGNTSCNGFSGGFSLAGSALSFGPLAQSKRFCTQTADQERQFMDALRNTRGFRIYAEALELLGDDGQILLTLEARTGGDDHGE